MLRRTYFCVHNGCRGTGGVANNTPLVRCHRRTAQRYWPLGNVIASDAYQRRTVCQFLAGLFLGRLEAYRSALSSHNARRNNTESAPVAMASTWSLSTFFPSVSMKNLNVGETAKGTGARNGVRDNTYYACCVESQRGCFSSNSIRTRCCAEPDLDVWRQFQKAMPLIAESMQSPRLIEENTGAIDGAIILIARLMHKAPSPEEIAVVRRKFTRHLDYDICQCVGNGEILYAMVKEVAASITWPHGNASALSSSSRLYTVTLDPCTREANIEQQVFLSSYVFSNHCGPGEAVRNLFQAFSCLIRANFVFLVQYFIAAFVFLLASPCDFANWNIDPNYVTQVLQQLLRSLKYPPNTAAQWYNFHCHLEHNTVFAVENQRSLRGNQHEAIDAMTNITQPICWVNDVLRINR
eukprot:GEMP01020274.1.p1 GENE.GEMP01020274.1~~GEMP01020274.1.p1  ORF type:complete len:409 (+),score=46.45 GEMP01020274.1:989-2215(+)